MARRTEPQLGLGRAIRQLREERELSQEAVAEAAGIHPTWVSHIESGRKNPAWGTVRRISAALGVSMAELATLAEELDGRS